MNERNSTTVLIHLRSKSAKKLELLQVMNNELNHVTAYNYLNPQFADGFFYVWFYADMKTWNDPTDKFDAWIEAKKKMDEK